MRHKVTVLLLAGSAEVRALRSPSQVGLRAHLPESFEIEAQARWKLVAFLQVTMARGQRHPVHPSAFEFKIFQEFASI